MAKQFQNQADQVSDQQIAQRAYEIWEREGRPDGRADEHWCRAAELLRQQTSSMAAQTSNASGGKSSAAKNGPRRDKKLEMVS